MTHLRHAAVVIAASLLLGGLTSWAQGFLPEAVSSFANSPSGWTILTVLLVAAVRPSLGWGAVLGVLSFVSLVLGYTIASELRGLTYSPVYWGAIGVVAGPFVGAAAAAVVGRHPVRAALGAGSLAGVLVADGIYGLTVVDATTSPVYWTICLVLGTALVVATAVRLRTVTTVAVLLVATAAATGVLSAGYAKLNGEW
ncbi:hypothetical protein SAMN04489844_4007 [Nocardioides exalbidus]|uniref:Uncharacterized protein n=1 Tax=Nocardioides exalbidus TaxID=402596 RepID=A0A1H4Z3I2_9ACTN|nr:DUF6518 family protein [Nocardioides exalbidus]SED24713.1 hypothetical protein SAMN04489844_4007 [Nocardioides exalbidus]